MKICNDIEPDPTPGDLLHHLDRSLSARNIRLTVVYRVGRTGRRTMTRPGRCKVVAYLRTSTADQHVGLEAQRTTIGRITGERGSTIVRTFTEHESGANDDRPELDKAIRHARRVGAV